MLKQKYRSKHYQISCIKRAYNTFPDILLQAKVNLRWGPLQALSELYYADFAVCFKSTGPISQLTPLPPTISGIKIFSYYLLPPGCFYALRACRKLCLKSTGPSEPSAQCGTMGGAGGTGGDLEVFSQQPAQQARFEAPVC